MQVEPIKPTFKAPVAKSLKQKYHKLLSNVGSKFNLRRYSGVRQDAGLRAPHHRNLQQRKPGARQRATRAGPQAAGVLPGRGLRSFTLALNLSNSRTQS